VNFRNIENSLKCAYNGDDDDDEWGLLMMMNAIIDDNECDY
jgi:hypothetical protein